MTFVRVLRAAWAGALAAAAAGFSYLTFAPVPASGTTDRLLGIACALAGAGVGVAGAAWFERRSRGTAARDEGVLALASAPGAET